MHILLDDHIVCTNASVTKLSGKKSQFFEDTTRTSFVVGCVNFKYCAWRHNRVDIFSISFDA